MTDDNEPEVPSSWMAAPYRGPVLDNAGGVIGTAESLEGDEQKDIFHGIVVNSGKGHDHVEVLADRITRITNKAIYTDLAPSEVGALEPYQEEPRFTLAWGGLFRKHPEWREVGKPPPTIGGSL